MTKNLLEQDKNNSETGEKPADELTYEEIKNSHFSEIDDEENLLEIPETAIAAPSKFEATDDEINLELPAEPNIDEMRDETRPDDSGTIFQTPAEPETIGETARQSGLAYGAAITLFGSVIFMLLLGWGADLLFGTSPWGIIVGVALGAIIGFFQFFKITSQIFKK